MMPEPIDHFEALFNGKYTRWFDLNGSPALVEIIGIESNVEMTLPGGAKSKRPLMKFKQIQGGIEKDNVKPLVLNKTNGNEIAKIHGPKPSQWVGKQVVLFQTTTKVGREEKNCIRIRASKR